MNEELFATAELIVDQLRLEKSVNCENNSIGYIAGEIEEVEIKKWILRDERKMSSTVVRNIHGTVLGTSSSQRNTVFTNNDTVWRDSKFGRLIYEGIGKHTYE